MNANTRRKKDNKRTAKLVEEAVKRVLEDKENAGNLKKLLMSKQKWKREAAKNFLADLRPTIEKRLRGLKKKGEIHWPD